MTSTFEVRRYIKISTDCVASVANRRGDYRLAVVLVKMVMVVMTL